VTWPRGSRTTVIRPSRTSPPREPRTFEALLEAHMAALWRGALRLCGGHRADAEDLLQDAALRALEHFAELREPAAARGWLFTILVRTSHNRRRAHRRRAETACTDLGEPEFEAALAAWDDPASQEERVDAGTTRERLAAALDRLDESLRAVIWLGDVEGFRQREIAQMLDVPEGTVASRLYRARRALRELLRPHATIIAERRTL